MYPSIYPDINPYIPPNVLMCTVIYSRIYPDLLLSVLIFTLKYPDILGHIPEYFRMDPRMQPFRTRVHFAKRVIARRFGLSRVCVGKSCRVEINVTSPARHLGSPRRTRGRNGEERRKRMEARRAKSGRRRRASDTRRCCCSSEQAIGRWLSFRRWCG